MAWLLEKIWWLLAALKEVGLPEQGGWWSSCSAGTLWVLWASKALHSERLWKLWNRRWRWGVHVSVSRGRDKGTGLTEPSHDLEIILGDFEQLKGCPIGKSCSHGVDSRRTNRCKPEGTAGDKLALNGMGGYKSESPITADTLGRQVNHFTSMQGGGMNTGRR